MRVTQNNSHVSDALGRIVQQYSKAVNLQDLISSLVNQVQKIEDDLQSMYNRLDIDVSENVQLDGIGDIIGIARQGYDDDTYKILIKGKIAANVSKGTPGDIIQVFNILTSGSDAFLMELFPAQIAIMNNGSILAGLETLVKTMTEGATAAGVGLDYIGDYNGDLAFSFAGGSGLGFTDLKSQGVTTSSASGRLIDSSADFITDGIVFEDVVYNDTDSTKTTVISVFNSITLLITDNIFATSEGYHIVDGSIGGEFGKVY